VGAVLFLFWLRAYSTVIDSSPPAAVFKLAVRGGYNAPVEPLGFEYEVLHEKQPRVLWAPNFLTEKECDRIVEIAMPGFVRSQVAVHNKGQKQQPNAVDDVRTSSGTWISRNSDEPAVKTFVSRMSRWSGLPPQNGEDLQILQYQIGQQYKPHNDYFDPKFYQGYLENGGQRIASVLCFLNDVEDGGETIFPKANLKVKPKKGGAVLWFNTFANGTLDEGSLHGGSPVIKGSKYAAVQWMRQLQRT